MDPSHQSTHTTVPEDEDDIMELVCEMCGRPLIVATDPNGGNESDDEDGQNSFIHCCHDCGRHWCEVAGEVYPEQQEPDGSSAHSPIATNFMPSCDWGFHFDDDEKDHDHDVEDVDMNMSGGEHDEKEAEDKEEQENKITVLDQDEGESRQGNSAFNLPPPIPSGSTSWFPPSSSNFPFPVQNTSSPIDTGAQEPQSLSRFSQASHQTFLSSSKAAQESPKGVKQEHENYTSAQILPNKLQAPQARPQLPNLLRNLRETRNTPEQCYRYGDFQQGTAQPTDNMNIQGLGGFGTIHTAASPSSTLLFSDFSDSPLPFSTSADQNLQVLPDNLFTTPASPMSFDCGGPSQEPTQLQQLQDLHASPSFPAPLQYDGGYDNTCTAGLSIFDHESATIQQEVQLSLLGVGHGHGPESFVVNAGTGQNMMFSQADHGLIGEQQQLVFDNVLNTSINNGSFHTGVPNTLSGPIYLPQNVQVHQTYRPCPRFPQTLHLEPQNQAQRQQQQRRQNLPGDDLSSYPLYLPQPVKPRQIQRPQCQQQQQLPAAFPGIGPGGFYVPVMWAPITMLHAPGSTDNGGGGG